MDGVNDQILGAVVLVGRIAVLAEVEAERVAEVVVDDVLGSGRIRMDKDGTLNFPRTRVNGAR